VDAQGLLSRRSFMVWKPKTFPLCKVSEGTD